MKRGSILLLTTVLFISACSKKPASNSYVGPIDNTPSVTTFAGSGSAGAVNGTKQEASFNGPAGISMNSDGFIFVADKQNNIIRIISPQGVVNSIGTGAQGFNNAKDSVTFNFPNGVGTDASGNIYVADQSNGAVRAISTAGVVTTFASVLNAPSGVVADVAGNIYVAEGGFNRIDKYTSKGVKSVFAGTGVRGAANGPGATATFNQPGGLAIDANGNIYVADQGNNLIRKILPDGTVSTLAGSGGAGAANGSGTAASFSSPADVSVDTKGNVYVADAANNLIRKITPAGVVTTLAGTGSAGSANGALTAATFNSPQGVAVDQYGRVFVSDTGNNLIRMINP